MKSGHWDDATKSEVSRRLAIPGATVAQVSRDLGLRRETVRQYAAKLRAASSEFQQPEAKPGATVETLRDQFSTYEQIHGCKIAVNGGDTAKWQSEKPRIRVKAISVQRSDEPIYKVLAIGDHHDKPGRDKTRALWIGRHAAETRPDAIVSIGDWPSLDSLSSHEAPGSQNDADRPAFHEELDSLDESLSRFHEGIPVGAIPVFHTHGNHEHRAWRAANRQPKQSGDLPFRLDTVFARYQWHTKPFGEFLDLYGVDFVHCPLNVMGREMGGENVERNIGNKSLRSLVFGHTHRSNVMNITKVGQQRKLTIINLGTSMPWGQVEKYNGLSMTGWSYGVFELRIQAGQILSAKHFDMLELESLYA